MLEIKIWLIDGGYYEHELGAEKYQLYLDYKVVLEGRELVDAFYTDDWAAPPTTVQIVGTLDDGTAVDVSIHCETPRKRRR
jgi:hypothetical protein